MSLYLGDTVIAPNISNAANKSLSNLDATGQAVIDGKADTDLSNVPTSKGILAESYVNGTSWYRVYSDGWCEQGGYVTGTGTVTFLKPYKQDTIPTITFGGYSNYDAPGWYSYSGCYNSVSNTGFTHKTDANFRKHWVAKGYIN